MDSLFLRILKQWLPLAVALSAVCFVIYYVVQQDIRIGANDPQIQMAEDTANALNANDIASVSGNIDVAKSLAPFTIIYDKNGTVVSSNAILYGKTPVLPSGALNGNKGTDLQENRITWQPENGVRLASVIVPYSKGSVLVGRNMREIENREDQQFQIVDLGWIVSLIATLGSVVVVQTLLHKKKK